MSKRKIRDPEAAYWDNQIKAEAEAEDFEVFAAAYSRATGDHLTEIDRPDPPDFLCVRSDGSEVGVELTQIMRSPDTARWDEILYRKSDMDTWDAAAEFERLLYQKARKLSNFPTPTNILLIQSCDTDFSFLSRHLLEIPIPELETIGFQEIWLGDYQGFRIGAHYGIEMLGLYPEPMRFHVPRADWDQKPYG